MKKPLIKLSGAFLLALLLLFFQSEVGQSQSCVSSVTLSSSPSYTISNNTANMSASPTQVYGRVAFINSSVCNSGYPITVNGGSWVHPSVDTQGNLLINVDANSGSGRSASVCFDYIYYIYIQQNGGCSVPSQPGQITINDQANQSSVCANSTAVYSISPVSGATNGYSWDCGGGTVISQNGTSATIKAGTASVATVYVLAKNSCGNSPTSSKNITVNLPPSITSHPSSRDVCEGSNTLFSVTASGSGLTYRWQYSNNGGSSWTYINGANSSNYGPTTTVAMNGLYRCEVSNAACSVVYSNPATLTVRAKETFTVSMSSSSVICTNKETYFHIDVSNNSSANYEWYKNSVLVDDNRTGNTQYYFPTKPVNNNDVIKCKVITTETCKSNQTAEASITIQSVLSLPGTPSFSAPTDVCPNSSMSFTAYSSYASSFNWSVSGATLGGGQGSATANVTFGSSLSYIAVSGSNVCGTGPVTTKRIDMSLAITSQPSDITAYLGSPVSFKTVTSGIGLNYQWQYSSNGGNSWNNIAGTTGSDYSTYSATTTTSSMNGIYRCQVGRNGCASVYSNSARLSLLALPLGEPYSLKLSEDMNYIFTVTPKIKSSVTGALALIEGDHHTGEAVIEEITYFDGLGRPAQKTAIHSSPAGKDMVQPVVYDDFGRETLKYLPYVSSATDGTQSDGSYKSGAVTNQASFYQTLGFGATELPYALTVFESSPLNRVLQQGAPGVDWQPSAGNAVGFAYQANISGEVAMYKVKDDGTLEGSGSYDVNQLYVTQTEDENKHLLKEYKDKEGQIVLKAVNDGTSWLKTYYVYDDYGLLRFVLPPKAVQELAGIPEGIGEAEVVTSNKTVNAYEGKSYILKLGATLTLGNGFHFASSGGSVFMASQASATNADVMNQLAYQYTYDPQHRMITKKLPGADPVYMVYDNRDRLVLTQDGEQRKPDSNNKSNWLFTKYDELNRPVITGLVTTSRSHSQLQTDYKNYNQNETADGGAIGYTFTDYTNVLSFLSANILSITYYDNYNFMQPSGLGSMTYDLAHGYSQTKIENLKGLVTGSRVKVLDGNEFNSSAKWINSISYYDKRYRVIQTQHTLYDGASGGIEIASTLYDFPGKAIQAKQSQTFGSVTTKVEKWFTYDQAGRLTKTDLSINDATSKTVISQLAYNELGQLQQKKLGGIQDVDYKYNIRGWLTNINDPDNLNTDLFGMKLLYNVQNSNLGNTKQFNGNISAMVWNSSQKSEQGYAFSYDGINRLTTSDYKKVTNGVWGESNAYEEKSIGYDANGNINTLVRTGAAETNNVLANYAYHYNGNQLNDLNGGTTFTYDKNGNTTKDGLRGFDISYNLLNLPGTISKGTDNLSYIYSTTGEKLAKLMNGVTQQYYAGSMVYNNSKQLDYLLHEEGTVKKVGSSFTYEYYLKDHLGNTRVVFNSSGATEQNTEYYPFGLTFQNNNLGVNKYLYNGKELQDETIGGTYLGMYDYGNRFYDPQVGRFQSVDHLAEKFSYMTPYQYGSNNPATLIDLDGLEGIAPPLPGEEAREEERIEETPAEREWERNTESNEEQNSQMLEEGNNPNNFDLETFAESLKENESTQEEAKETGKPFVLVKLEREMEREANGNKTNKNSNKYKGDQIVYKIEIDEELHKFGKADATRLSKTTNVPVRLQRQLNKLQRQNPSSIVKGTVIYRNRNISTESIKKVETKNVRGYVRRTGKYPPDNQNHPGVKLPKKPNK